MICSLGELGISDSVVPKEFADGIQILHQDAVPGEEVFSYLDLDDEIIELSITPNRADALSMRGVAHEVAAIYDKAVSFKEFSLTETNEAAADALSVDIETDKAPYYAARILDNVTIAPSPQWLQNILMNEGIRPINNVVDVTNYILLYFGQPMHAFDLDTFEGTDIRVREARAGEKLVPLDGEERDLETNDLVITVADKPVALAGVMGVKQQKYLKILVVLSLKRLFSMVNPSARLADALTFVRNHLLALKKGSTWQLLMKPLMRRLA